VLKIIFDAGYYDYILKWRSESGATITANNFREWGRQHVPGPEARRPGGPARMGNTAGSPSWAHNLLGLHLRQQTALLPPPLTPFNPFTGMAPGTEPTTLSPHAEQRERHTCEFIWNHLFHWFVHSIGCHFIETPLESNMTSVSLAAALGALSGGPPDVSLRLMLWTQTPGRLLFLLWWDFHNKYEAEIVVISSMVDGENDNCE